MLTFEVRMDDGCFGGVEEKLCFCFCKAHRSLEEDWKPVYEGCISMAAEEQGFVASEE